MAEIDAILLLVSCSVAVAYVPKEAPSLQSLVAGLIWMILSTP